MEPWQRFGRQRLAQSRWNCEPAAIDAVDRQAFEAACNCETFFTLPDGRRVIRFVTSWATQPSDVDELLALAKTLA